MARQRKDTLADIVKLVGSDVLEVTAVGTAWPALVLIHTTSGSIPIALHVSTVSDYYRGEHERRFQNPVSGDLIQSLDGRKPLLLGLDDSNGAPILVVLDGTSRLEKQVKKRNSYLFNRRIVTQARLGGWAEHTSTTGDRFSAFHPRLLPTYVEAETGNLILSTTLVQTAIVASGLMDGDEPPSVERARRAASTLVRDAKFGKAVRDAYGGRCAMCTLGLGLIAGAHIHPASAPGSHDEVWNGLALCHNHHAAFDNHRIWVSSTGAIKIDPAYQTEAADHAVDKAFLTGTRPDLWLPMTPALRPRHAMFERRYSHYDGLYDWVS